MQDNGYNMNKIKAIYHNKAILGLMKKDNFVYDMVVVDQFTPERNYYNYLNYLPSMNNLNVNYSFAENDFDASRGLVMSKFPGINVNMLKDMGHSNAAMEFVKRQFSKIFQFEGRYEI